MSAQILSLCSGYGGLDIAVEDFYGAQTAYYCEIEPACLEVLAGRFPTALNVGSLEELKTGTIEADIITAGYPCQPFSLAGKREGGFDDRHVWLPTPTAWIQDEMNTENYLLRRMREKQKGRNGNGFGLPLDMAIKFLGDTTTELLDDGKKSHEEPHLFQ